MHTKYLLVTIKRTQKEYSRGKKENSASLIGSKKEGKKRSTSEKRKWTKSKANRK